MAPDVNLALATTPRDVALRRVCRSNVIVTVLLLYC